MKTSLQKEQVWCNIWVASILLSQSLIEINTLLELEICQIELTK